MINKKISFIILFMCISVLCTMKIFAGDIPETIITDKNTDVIIGTITKIDDAANKTTIQISKALFETIDSEEIELDNFNYFTGVEEYINPKVGDYCAVAVVRENDGISLYNSLCARADSLEPETLKLATDEWHDFAVRMNEYINNGDYSAAHRAEVLGSVNTPSEEPKEPDEPTSDEEQDVLPNFDMSIVNPESDAENTPEVPQAPYADYIGNKLFWLFLGIVVAGTAVALYFITPKKQDKKINGKKTGSKKIGSKKK